MVILEIFHAEICIKGIPKLSDFLMDTDSIHVLTAVVISPFNQPRCCGKSGCMAKNHCHISGTVVAVNEVVRISFGNIVKIGNKNEPFSSIELKPSGGMDRWYVGEITN